MVQRLPFPRAVLPLSVLGTALIDLFVALLAFVVYAYITGAGLPITALWFPPLLLIEIVLAIGVTMLGSALNVFARDIRLAVPLIVQLWLFLTPVMYPLSTVPASLRTWYLVNPMTGLVEAFRDVLIYGNAPAMADLIPSLIGAVVLLVIGTWYFTTTEPRFADVI
jgi:ABC-type polysaccharide/polyol phosphate export permease